MLFKINRGAVFFVCFPGNSQRLKVDEKEGAGIILKTDLTKGVSKREINTIIVGIDDKNCLAELTVVLEFNQGVRQWPYIIAGVLFFGTFFCTSKRKYKNLKNENYSRYNNF